jgi:hypothetical protein
MPLGRLWGATSQQLGEAARQLGARVQRHQAALAASLTAAIDRGASLLAEAENRRNQRTAELRRAAPTAHQRGGLDPADSGALASQPGGHHRPGTVRAHAQARLA